MQKILNVIIKIVTINYEKNIFMRFVLVVCLGVAIGVSPFRSSRLVNLLINITGG